MTEILSPEFTCQYSQPSVAKRRAQNFCVPENRPPLGFFNSQKITRFCRIISRSGIPIFHVGFNLMQNPPSRCTARRNLFSSALSFIDIPVCVGAEIN